MKQALVLDTKNGNTLWGDSAAKELDNVKVAFEILPDATNAPIDHQFVQCNIVFDTKMEEFRFKARLIAGGHMTEAPGTITYACVLSRKTV